MLPSSCSFRFLSHIPHIKSSAKYLECRTCETSYHFWGDQPAPGSHCVLPVSLSLIVPLSLWFPCFLLFTPFWVFCTEQPKFLLKLKSHNVNSFSKTSKELSLRLKSVHKLSSCYLLDWISPHYPLYSYVPFASPHTESTPTPSLKATAHGLDPLHTPGSILFFRSLPACSSSEASVHWPL